MVRLACGTYSVTHPTSPALCSGHAILRLSQVQGNWLARLRLAFAGHCGWNHCLRDEFLCCRRLDRTLGGSVIQYAVPVLAYPRLPLHEARRIGSKKVLAASSDRDPAWDRGNPSCDGDLLCDE